jgi:hypothetical protein
MGRLTKFLGSSRGKQRMSTLRERRVNSSLARDMCAFLKKPPLCHQSAPFLLEDKIGGAIWGALIERPWKKGIANV